jgi:hypothetical protein
MSYWDETDNYLSNHGGVGPICPYCGQEMFAADDHGRFMCLCGGAGKVHDVVSGETRAVRKIPQVELPEGVEDLPDEVKKEISPLNRLHLPPTEEERKFFEQSMRELRGEFDE